MSNEEPGFLDAFPKDPGEFAKKVREGIWFIIPVGSDEDRPVLAAELKLPQPPEGYAWHLDPGTLISGEAITFRLWDPRLGAFPD